MSGVTGKRREPGNENENLSKPKGKLGPDQRAKPTEADRGRFFVRSRKKKKEKRLR